MDEEYREAALIHLKCMMKNIVAREASKKQMVRSSSFPSRSASTLKLRSSSVPARFVTSEYAMNGLGQLECMKDC